MAKEGGAKIPIGPKIVVPVVSPATKAPQTEGGTGGGDVLVEQFTREFAAVLQLVRERQTKEFVAEDFGCDLGDVGNAPQEVACFGAITQKLVPLVDRLVRATPEQLTTEKKAELLLQLGDKFFQAQEFRVASAFFYEKALEEDELAMEVQPEDSQMAQLPVQGRILVSTDHIVSRNRGCKAGQVFVRALYGVAMCSFHVQKRLDPCLRHPGTLEKLVEVLRLLQVGMETAVALERENPSQFSWLVLNGSLLIFSVAKPMQRLGFSREVIAFFKWCLLAMESAVALATTKYIIWRVQIGAAICDCYEDLGFKETTKSAQHAKAVIACAAYVQQAVQRLRKEEELDLPLPVEVQRILAQAETTSTMLVVRAKATAGGGGVTRSLVETTFSSTSDQMRFAIDAMEKLSRANSLQLGGQSVTILPPTPKLSSLVAQTLSDLLALVLGIISPLLESLAGAAVDTQPPGGTKSDENAHTLQTTFPLSFHLLAIRYCYELSRPSADIGLLAKSARVRATMACEGLTEMVAEMVECEISLYEAIHAVQQAWFASITPASDEVEDTPTSASGLKLSLTDKTIPEEKLLIELAKAIQDFIYHRDGTVTRTNRCMLTAVALQMWREFASPLLEELDAAEPLQLSKSLVCLTCELLLTIHLTFTAVEFEDLLLHGQVCLRLATLLSARGKARMAGQVTRRCLERINDRRDELVRFDSHFHSVASGSSAVGAMLSLSSASFSCGIRDHAHPNRSSCSTADKVNSRDCVGVKGTGSQFGGLYQDLCCVQADLLLLLYRVELEAATTVDSLPLTSNPVPGTSAPVASTTASSVLSAAEKKLAAECRQNGYSKVLLNIQCLAHPLKTMKERLGLADESLRLLQRLETHEHELHRQLELSTTHVGAHGAAAADTTTQSTPVPVAPVIVSRSSAAITVRVAEYHPSLPSLRKKRVHYYMVFAKPAGAGTAVSVNNNQLPGTAEPIYPPHLQVTISGLLPNESYVFAVAAFDSKHELIYAIGETSDPVVALNPLPLPLCYGYLAKVCYEAQLTERANKAAGYLYNTVVSRAFAARPAWKANPFYRQALKRDVVAQLPVAILNLCIQALLILCHDEPGDPDREGRLVSTADLDARSLTPSQVDALEDTRKVSIGVEIACAADNLEAVRVLCFKGYRLLLPLLHLKGSSDGLTFAALVTFYQALHIIPRAEWDVDTHSICARIGFELFRIAQDTTCEIARVTLPLVVATCREADATPEQTSSAGGLARSETFESMREVMALYELCSSIQGSAAPDNAVSAVATPAAATLSPRTAAGKAGNKGKSQSTTPQATPRAAGGDANDGAEGIAKLKPLDEILRDTGYDFAKAFQTLELHNNSDRQTLEFACKFCNAALQAGKGKTEQIELFMGTLKVSGAISEHFRITLSSLGGASLLPDVKAPDVDEPFVTDKSAPSSARSGKLLTPVKPEESLASSRSNQGIEIAGSCVEHDESAGTDDDYLYRWCGELFFIQATLLYRKIADLSASIEEVDAANGPATEDCTYALLCENAEKVNDPSNKKSSLPNKSGHEGAPTQSASQKALEEGLPSNANAPAAASLVSDADPAAENPEQLEPTTSEQLDELFGQFLEKISASCRLFRLSNSWQGLQTVAQYLWDAIWIAWVAPSRFAASSERLNHLSRCVDALLDMMDTAVNGTREQKTTHAVLSATIEAGTQASVSFAPEPSMARTTMVSSAASALNVDQMWLARLMTYALRAFCASEDWQSIVRKGNRYHFLCGNSVEGNRFSEQNFPLLVYAQQQILNHQELLLATAEAEMAAYVTAFLEQEAKKKKKKSRLVVEEVLSPEEVAFRTTKQDMEHRIHRLTASRNRERDELQHLSQLYDGLTKSINKSLQALDICHNLLEKYRRLEQCNDNKEKGESALSALRRQIIAAYNRCMLLSRQKRQKRVVCQALHELGDFYLACGDSKSATKSWLEALDNAFSALNVVTCWREVIDPPADQALGGGTAIPDKIAGDELWIGLQSCNVLAKLILHASGPRLQQAVDYALMAATIFTRFFACSLPHPTKCFLFGSYRVLGQFWPGRKLLADPERISFFSFGVMLLLVPEVLLQYEHQYAVYSMPVLAGYEYVAAWCLEDVNHVANARRLRVDALAQCGRFQEAFAVLGELLRGAAMHNTTVESAPEGSICFNDSKPILDEANASVVEWLSTLDVERTQQQLRELYNDALVEQILVTILRLVVALARHEGRFDRDAAQIRPAAMKMAQALLELKKTDASTPAGTPRDADAEPLQTPDASTPRDDVSVHQTPRIMSWEELQLHELRGEIILQQSYLAFYDGQWGSSKTYCSEAIREYISSGEMVFQQPVHLGLEQELKFSLFCRRSTFIAKCRAQTVACELATAHYRAAIALAEIAITEAKSTNEEHLRQQLELQRLQAAVFLGEREKAERELTQLRVNFQRCHTSSSMLYVRVLQTVSSLLRSKALVESQPSPLRVVCECLSEAEQVLDMILERDGWIGVDDDEDAGVEGQHDKRLSLYRPALPMFVEVHADLAQALLECPLESGRETVRSRREKALRSIHSGLRALEHTTQRMSATKARLLLMKGALLRKTLCTKAPAGGDDASWSLEVGTAKLAQNFQTCVDALTECIRLSIEGGGHDRRLMRLALVELVDLFSQKLHPGEEDAHIQAAFHYLSLALRVQSHESVLFDTLELQNGSVTSVEKLPPPVCAAIVAQSEARADAPPTSSSPDATPRTPDTMSIINYFVRLLRMQHILPVCTTAQQEVCVLLHFFLAQNHSTYARTCCLDELPAVPSSDPEIRAGLVCAHWGQDLTPAITSGSTDTATAQILDPAGTSTLYFTLGTTQVDIAEGTSATENAAATTRMEKFASSPLLSKRCGLNRQRVQCIKTSLSHLRTHMEDEDSLIIDRSAFPHTLHLILLDIQRLFRAPHDNQSQHLEKEEHGEDGDGLFLTEDVAGDTVYDLFGNPIALGCTLELVRRLENLFAIHKGANVADNALCYFLRDLLD